MKVFIESKECSLHVRACFATSRATFACQIVDELFSYEGYVTVSHYVNNVAVELKLTDDLSNYVLPADLNEVELFVDGEEADLSDYAVVQKMFAILAFANDKDIKIIQLKHPSQQFCINKRVLPNVTKALVHTKKHLQIQEQAIEYMRNGTLPDDLPRSRADYVKKLAKEFSVNPQTGHVMWQRDKESPKLCAITSAAHLDNVVCDSLATTSPLCSRGQNVCGNVASNALHQQKAYARIEEQYRLVGIRAPLRVKAKTSVRRQTKKAARRTCQRTLFFVGLLASQTALIPPDAIPLGHLLMDYKTLHPDGQTGEVYLLLLVDLLTKYVWYLPTMGKPAQGVVDFFQERLDEWEKKGFRKPVILHTDNGGEFKNEIMEKLCREKGIQFRHGLPGHPQAQGAIERVVQTWWNAIRDRCKEADVGELRYNWVEHLTGIDMEYNNAHHSTTNWPPCWLMYGQIPDWGLSSQLPANWSPPRYNKAALQQHREEAFERIKKRAAKFTRKVPSTSYYVGQTVIVQLCSRAKGAKDREWNTFAEVLGPGSDPEHLRVKFQNTVLYRNQWSEVEVAVRLLCPLVDDIDLESSVSTAQIVYTPHNGLNSRDVDVYIEQLFLRRTADGPDERAQTSYLAVFSGQTILDATWVSAKDYSEHTLSHAEKLFLPYLPSVNVKYRGDSKLTDLKVLLNSVGGNVFAPEFKQYLGSDNWKVRGAMTFFTDVNEVRTASRFLIPRGRLSPYKDFLAPLFVLCSLWDPHLIRSKVVTTNPSTADGAPTAFLHAIFKAMVEKDIGAVEDAVLKYAEGLCLNAWKANERRTTCCQTMNLCTAIPSAEFNLVGGLFDPGADDPAVQCTKCKDILDVSLDLACMEYNMFSPIPLDQYICPMQGSEWLMEDVFLRTGRTGPAECPSCGTAGRFEWYHVPFDPSTAQYPLTIFIQRHRPAVEPIIQPTGPVRIAKELKIGRRTYQYCGWTAKMGQLSMVPHLKVSQDKAVRYCFTNAGLVLFVGEEANFMPKDYRHLDMLVYRLKNC